MSVSATNMLLEDGKRALALAPQSVSGSSAVNGTAFNQLAQASLRDALLIFANGEADGTPTSYSLAYKVQHSADNSNWADVSGLTASSTADNGLAVIAFKPGQLKRYIRAVVTPTFVEGTTPSVPVAAVLVLERATKAPV